MLEGNLTTAELCSHSRVGSTTVISQDRDSFRSCGGEDSVALDQEGARRAAHETTLFVLDSRLGKGNLLRLAHDRAAHRKPLATYSRAHGLGFKLEGGAGGVLARQTGINGKAHRGVEHDRVDAGLHYSFVVTSHRLWLP